MEPTLDLDQVKTPHLSGPDHVRDAWGQSLTTHSKRARSALEHATLALLGHRADTLRHLEDALQADPELCLAHVLRGFAYRLLARSDHLPMVNDALSRAEQTLALRGGNLREVLLTLGLRAWYDGDVSRAVAALGQASETHPHCLLSMKLHHAVCFMHGKLQLMRRGLERVVARMDNGMPGFGFALGCYAFALEETGSLQEAERYARMAIERNPADAWGYHALVHVLTTQDQTGPALALLRARGERFLGGNNFVAHIAWHQALCAIAEGQQSEALSLYDEEIVQPLGRDYRDLANCASLLYRLERAGVDVGDRWQPLARVATEHVGDHILAFADAHYMLALLGARQTGAAGAFLDAMRARAAGRIDHDAQVARRVGIPLLEGMQALYEERAQVALWKLWPLACSSLRLGGSHAQRELFEQLAADAALAAGNGRIAEQLLENQLQQRPHCAWAKARKAELTLQRRSAPLLSVR